MRALRRALLIFGAVTALTIPAGVAAADLSPHIVGGQDATQAYPFMASLNSSDGWFCGASLIRPTWILTARHCVTGENDTPSAPQTLTFRIGSLQRDSGGTVAQGKRVVRNDSGWDTALVELTAPVPQQPTDIATSAPVGSTVRLIGWGCTVDPGCNSLPTVLQQLDTSILPDSSCGSDEHQICLNDPDGWRGNCYGDSGGPALLAAGSSWLVAGTSFGNLASTCGKGLSVFSEVPNLKSWIESYAGPGGSTAPPPPTDGPNLTLNRPASSAQASCNGNETPSKAVNGSVSGGLTDKWCSAASGAKSLTVDLGASHHLAKLVVRHAGAGGESSTLNTKNFTIGVSADGTTWTTVVTAAANTASVTTHPVSADGRYIRLATSDAIARIYEFEAY
jgi:secreted trypsin-like serine protease